MQEMSGKADKNQKWIMLFLLWLMFFVAYLDRVNIAVAGPTMMKELGMSPLVFGSVLSAFTFGYALTQIPGGFLADKFGAKRMLVIALVWWSIFTGVTGLVSSVTSLIAVRVLFGIGEGLGIGAQFKLVGDFFSSKERSSANALFLTALAMGPAFVAPLASYLIGILGWRELFLCFTIPGLLMAYLFHRFTPKNPAEAVPAAAMSENMASEPSKENSASWKDVLAFPTTWLIFFTYMSFNIAFWGFMLWLPSYLSMSRQIALKSMGIYASLPYMAGFFGLLFLGWLGSKPLYRYRAALISVSYLIAGIALYVAFIQETAMDCLMALSCAGFFLYGGFGPFWAVVLDHIPEQFRATLSGFVNFGGQIGGFLAPIIVGAIVSATGSFLGGFLFMTGGLVTAAVLLFVLQILGSRKAKREVEASVALEP
ncbi:MAG: MFS transporter [Sporomusaceae bacterium]|nr:MFS transporter [Sporomusaceae bacterium]